MKAAILGATRGMGRALARRLAARGETIHLLGRSVEELEKSAADLEARGAAGSVGVSFCDLEEPSSFATSLDGAEDAMEGFDTIIVTAGMFALQSKLEQDRALARRLLNVNFTNTILFCEEARERLLERGGGTLCVFSSVAGDRGRKPVAIYGASKAGLSHYLESLDARHRLDGLRVICVKPGFVKTEMTDGIDPPPFAGEPDQVAKIVVSAIDRGAPEVYAPHAWFGVMQVVKRLPRQVMRRVGF